MNPIEEVHIAWEDVIHWLTTQGIKLGVILLLTFLALLIVSVIANRLTAIYKRVRDDNEHLKRAETLGSMFRTVMRLAVLSVAVMLILQQLGIEIGPLLAAAGVAGIAIGFGAQHIVQDVANGFFILLDDEIRVGDVVEIADKSGIVERVNLRQVVIRGLDGNVHYIPNSNITVVTNMTKEFSYCLLEIGVAYREDIDEVIEVMAEIGGKLRQDPNYKDYILEDIEILGLDQFGDSALVIKARIKTLPIKQWKIRRAYNRLLKAAFDERNIEIPFPNITLYMGEGKDGSAPPLRIRREDKESVG
ncbi:MAG TPA: mechanosensitive ion channel family protein [candidate division Zixibacteria bacterium]|nr:mechanosensitive ion channel family protein [candidate division Zixibacteria bacterium]